jgi:hypothetical protein
MDTTVCCPNGHPIAAAAAPAYFCPVCGAAIPRRPPQPRSVSPEEPTEILPLPHNNAPPAPQPAAVGQPPAEEPTTQLVPAASASPSAQDDNGRSAKMADAPTERLVAAAPPPQPQAAEEPQPEEADLPVEPQYGFAGVYYGLAWHYWKIAAALLAVVVLAGVVALSFYALTGPPSWVLLIVEGLRWCGLAVLLFLVALALLLGLVGSWRCLTVPPDTRGSRQMILVSGILEAVPFVALAVAAAADFLRGDGWPANGMRSGMGQGLWWTAVLAPLASLGSLSFFLLFAARLSRYFRNPALASEALALIGRLWATAGGWVVAAALLALLAWFDAHRHRFDVSIRIGVGLFFGITGPLAVWAGFTVLRGILDVIGSLRHLIWIRTT